MLEPFDENNLPESLMAFADGELDAAHSAAVLEYLVAHPEWLATLRDHQLLRHDVHRAAHAKTPAIPEAFRNKVIALAQASVDRPNEAVEPQDVTAVPQSSQNFGAPLSNAKRTVWWPAGIAAAIALVVGLLAGNLLLPKHAPSASPGIAVQNAVPPTLVAAVTKVHVECSRFLLQAHNGPFPTAAPFNDMAADVRQTFHAKVPYPDLSSIGYEFVGAGPCLKPLQDTVHLLYRAMSPTRRDTLSILVQPYRGQIDIPIRQFSAASILNAPHPAYVWRTDAVVYFLVTDDDDVGVKARDFLQLASLK